jgi:hypothetical protein
MIGEVNRALRALLTPVLPADHPVRFGLPEPGAEPGLYLFLADVREDEGSGGLDWEDVRDVAGRVVARRPPIRRFDLKYLITPESPDPDTLTVLLDAVLIAVDPGRRLDPELLGIDLAGKPVVLRLSDGGAAYSHLGLAPRTVLGLTVNAPLVLPLVTEISPAPDQLNLGVAKGGPRPAPERPAGPPLRRARIEE